MWAFLMDLIEKLQRYRLEKRITQQKLASKLGVSFLTVNRWLNRRTKPGQIHEYHIRKLLKLTKAGADRK